MNVTRILSRSWYCFRMGYSTSLTFDLPDVAEVAEKERITFYDASYVTIAKVQNLTLVTEDANLAEAASKHTKAVPAEDVL